MFRNLLEEVLIQSEVLNPLVSVVMPVYNREEYVGFAIDSIRGQTYKNWELLIIDDASTDGSLEIIKRLALCDSRILIFENEKNKGIHYCRNLGIQNAKGTLIAYLDSDDIAVSNRFQKQIDLLIKGFDLVGSSLLFINEIGITIGTADYPSDISSINRMMRYTLPVPNPSLLARRDVFECVGNYRFPCAEDYDFFLRAMDLGFKASNVEEPMVYMRMHSQNTGGQNVRLQRKLTNLAWDLHIQRVCFGKENSSWKSEIIVDKYNTPPLEGRAAYHYRIAFVKKQTNMIQCLYHLAIALILWPPNLAHLLRKRKT